MSKPTGGSRSWVYHERQQAALCGQHALNNLCQAPLFTPNDLKRIADRLDQQELSMFRPGSVEYRQRLMEGSGNVDSYGNFSLQVLQQALLALPTPINLPNIGDETVAKVEPTSFEGFICHRENHWFAIRKINDRYWNLNSFLKKPELISQFKLATEVAGLQKQGYTVFIGLPLDRNSGGRLPPPCTSDGDVSKGVQKYYWNEELLVKTAKKGAVNTSDKAGWSYEDPKETEIKDPANATQDGWLNVSGTGQALGSLMKAAETIDGRTNYVPSEQYKELEVKEESKKENKALVTRLQLRLPHNKKVIRWFEKEDTIAYMHRVVLSLCSVQPSGKQLQLSAGFPPKVLTDGDITLKDAGLLSAVVQCRWV